MAKKKQEEVKKGLDEWMGTFSDMMTLLMCFFVMLFSMSTIDAAKFEEAAQSFQQTISIFQKGAKAIGDGILVSNGVSQLNQLDEFFNTTGKTAVSDSDEIEFKENAQGAQAMAEKLGLTEKEMKSLLDELNMTEQEFDKLMTNMEEEKMKQSEELAEKIEESLAESMMQDKIDVEFNANCVILSLSGAFLFDSGQANLKEEAIPVLDKIGVILAKYAGNSVEIEGHTDSVPLNGGRYENNDVLSSYRALAVFNYLKENAAIDPGVMKHTGRGEYIPVADNSTPEGRAKNRRVEIKIYNALSAY